MVCSPDRESGRDRPLGCELVSSNWLRKLHYNLIATSSMLLVPYSNATVSDYNPYHDAALHCNCVRERERERKRERERETIGRKEKRIENRNLACHILQPRYNHTQQLETKFYSTPQPLTLRRLMSYIYGAPILDVSRSHTTTQHSR